MRCFEFPTAMHAIASRCTLPLQPPTFYSVERTAGNHRGKSEARERLRVRTRKPPLSSTWIGSGAEKEFPARTRRARTRLCPLRSHLALSPYGNREIHTRSLPEMSTLFTKLSQLANFFLRNIHISR